MIVGNKVDKVRGRYLHISPRVHSGISEEFEESAIVTDALLPLCSFPQEFNRTVSSEEGRAFAASRDPPWLFAECSAKKGGDDVSGAEGIFGKVVDKVRLATYTSRFLSLGALMRELMHHCRGKRRSSKLPPSTPRPPSPPQQPPPRLPRRARQPAGVHQVNTPLATPSTSTRRWKEGARGVLAEP
jgi:hypothetical protein